MATARHFGPAAPGIAVRSARHLEWIASTPSSSVKVSPAAQGPDSARTIYRVSRIVINADPRTTWLKSRPEKSRRAAHTLTSVSLVGGSGFPRGLSPGDAPLDDAGDLPVQPWDKLACCHVLFLHHEAGNLRCFIYRLSAID